MSAELVRHGNKKSVRAVPAKFKIAVAVMLQQPKEDLEAAATFAGMTTRQLRMYLGRPENRRYYFEQKRIAWAVAAAGNPAALRDVRDNSGNAMARVQAARVLELGEREMDGPNFGNRHTPQAAGITIVIETGGATAKVLGPPTIDVTPQPAREFEDM